MRPDNRGYFGEFGGKFVPETLMSALSDLELDFNKAMKDKAFIGEFKYYLHDYVGRPTPLYFAERLTKKLGGAKIYLKREDIAHTGAHKINNTVGQALLTRRMGKPRVIAETGAGQHGVATATVAALFGLKCEVYMGSEDIKRQALNVYRMKLLGANVIPVESGTKTLKDALNEAMRDWVTNVRDTHYILGTCAGAHPFPKIVRAFQSVIGKEARQEILKKEGRLPDYAIACVGGGSNAIGLFSPFYDDKKVKFIGVEAGGRGRKIGDHAASLSRGSVGILHGTKSYLLQTDKGQIADAHSISAGLDYPGVGPEHAFYKESGRAEYVTITDQESLKGLTTLCETEGIIPALESSHSIAYALKLAPKLAKNKIIVVCVSGRGDKDLDIIRKNIKLDLPCGLQ